MKQKVSLTYKAAIRICLGRRHDATLDQIAAEVIPALELNTRVNKLKDFQSHKDSCSTRLSEMIEAGEVVRIGRALYALGPNA